MSDTATFCATCGTSVGRVVQEDPYAVKVVKAPRVRRLSAKHWSPAQDPAAMTRDMQSLAVVTSINVSLFFGFRLYEAFDSGHIGMTIFIQTWLPQLAIFAVVLAAAITTRSRRNLLFVASALTGMVFFRGINAFLADWQNLKWSIVPTVLALCQVTALILVGRSYLRTRADISKEDARFARENADLTRTLR